MRVSDLMANARFSAGLPRMLRDTVICVVVLGLALGIVGLAGFLQTSGLLRPTPRREQRSRNNQQSREMELHSCIINQAGCGRTGVGIKHSQCIERDADPGCDFSGTLSSWVYPHETLRPVPRDGRTGCHGKCSIQSNTVDWHLERFGN
jgi:hypothetical protein